MGIWYDESVSINCSITNSSESDHSFVFGDLLVRDKMMDFVISLPEKCRSHDYNRMIVDTLHRK
jgi:hypothetical protein